MEEESCAHLPASVVIQDNVVDSTRWAEFPFKANDVVIDTFMKTGTTWVQQIVGQLVFGGTDEVSVGTLSPWVEYLGNSWHEVLETIQHQTHRRFVKSHLPRPALPLHREAQYIYVARDARDQIWSHHNHLVNLSPSARHSDLRSMDVRTYYHHLMDSSAPNVWPYWSHVLSWWNVRHLPNVLLVHFSDLKADLRAEIERIAKFLEIDVSGTIMERIVEHTEFKYMKRNAERIVGASAFALRDGPSTLINVGTNGRWRSVLTEEEAAKCDAVASCHLPPDCAHWLKMGRSGSAFKRTDTYAQAGG